MIRNLLALVLAVSCSVASAEDPLPKELPRDVEAVALRAAEQGGAAIYRHDTAAAVATDAALKVRAFKKDKRIQGWVTEDQGGQIIVTFIDQTPSALYRSVVSAEGVAGPIEILDSPDSLSSYQAGAAAARSLALASKFQPCSSSYNSVVLPSSQSPGNWVVYLLPGTTKQNVVPIGGTYRIETDASAVVSQRGFTRTCITLETSPRSVGLMITHLLDSVPTEAHVFWSLWAKKPLYVSTPPNGTLWVVKNGKIELVERKAGEG